MAKNEAKISDNLEALGESDIGLVPKLSKVGGYNGTSGALAAATIILLAYKNPDFKEAGLEVMTALTVLVHFGYNMALVIGKKLLKKILKEG